MIGWESDHFLQNMTRNGAREGTIAFLATTLEIWLYSEESINRIET